MSVSADPDRLLEAVGLSPLPMVVSNPRRPDNPLEMANQAFCQLTGYAERDVLGRNCRFLVGPGTDAAATEQIRSGLAGRRAVFVDIVNYRCDGTAFRNGVTITPLFGDGGELRYFLGSQVDLGDQRADAFARRQAGAAKRIQPLPARQREVLESMARGLLNKQIAWRLGISEKTVKMHRALLIERLGVANSAEAIRMAVEAGL